MLPSRCSSLPQLFPAVSLLFSGEEAYGKYLDLYANHTAYNNIKHIGKRPGYLQYLDILLDAQNGSFHSELSKEARFTKDYETCVSSFFLALLLYHIRRYIQALHTYLLSFTKRTEPLSDVDLQQQASANEFEKLWEAGELKSWAEDAVNGKKASSEVNGIGIWCSACTL